MHHPHVPLALVQPADCGRILQVSLPVVRNFVKRVEESALGVQVLKGVKPDQQLVKVVNDELIELMGGQKQELVVPRKGPQVRKQCAAFCCSLSPEQAPCDTSQHDVKPLAAGHADFSSSKHPGRKG